MFRLSNDDDVPELRTLWKKCFDADRVFLDLFFEKGYGLTRTYVMETEAGIVSALSIFPVKYAGHRGGYVYGVCTHPEHRGHRHAVSLLRHAEEQLLDKDLDFMILRPASHSLFEYYRQQCYDTTLYRSVKRVTKSFWSPFPTRHYIRPEPDNAATACCLNQVGICADTSSHIPNTATAKHLQ